MRMITAFSDFMINGFQTHHHWVLRLPAGERQGFGSTSQFSVEVRAQLIRPR